MSTQKNLSEPDQQLIEHLREHYFLFPRDYWKTIVGGAFAFLLTVGIISFGAAKAGLETAVAKKAADDIAALRVTAGTDAAAIASLRQALSGSAFRLREVESGGELGLTAKPIEDANVFGVKRLPKDVRGIRFTLQPN